MRWCRIKMNEIATKITKGTTPTTLGYSFRETGIAFLRVQNLADGKVNVKDDALFIDNATHSALERSQIQRGDLLVSIAGTIGRVAIVESDSAMNCNQAVAILRLKGKINKRYVLNWLGTPDARRQMAAKGVTGTITNLSLGQIKSLEIPLPPLAEQRRIAAILDEADGLRTCRRASLAELDTLLQSTFLQMFGDPVTNPMGWEVGNFEGSVYFQEGPGVRKWQFRDAGVKLINVRNIVEGELVLDNTSRYLETAEVQKKYAHFLLDEGDLVMSSSGVTWGKIAYVKSEHLPLCLNTSMIRLRPTDGRTTHAYIRAFVESESFRRQITRLITGSAQPNFGPSHLSKICLGLPPVDLQRRFAAIVESVEAQKARMRAHLAELDTLFASLQAAAFQGEL